MGGQLHAISAGSRTIKFVEDGSNVEIRIGENGRVRERLIFGRDVFSEIVSGFIRAEHNRGREAELVRSMPDTVYEELRDNEEARIRLASQQPDRSKFTKELYYPLGEARKKAKDRGMI